MKTKFNHESKVIDPRMVSDFVDLVDEIRRLKEDVMFLDYPNKYEETIDSIVDALEVVEKHVMSLIGDTIRLRLCYRKRASRTRIMTIKR